MTSSDDKYNFSSHKNKMKDNHLRNESDLMKQSDQQFGKKGNKPVNKIFRKAGRKS